MQRDWKDLGEASLRQKQHRKKRSRPRNESNTAQSGVLQQGSNTKVKSLERDEAEEEEEKRTGGRRRRTHLRRIGLAPDDVEHGDIHASTQRRGNL